MIIYSYKKVYQLASDIFGWFEYFNQGIFFDKFPSSLIMIKKLFRG